MKTFIGILTLSLFAVFLASGCVAQSRPTRLYRPCPASVTPASIELKRNGDIDLVPCSGRSILFNGATPSTVFSFSGSPRTNYYPYFSTETNLAKSPFGWNGSTYSFNKTTLDSEFVMTLTPDVGFGLGGNFQVGDFTTTPSTYFSVNSVAGAIRAQTAANRYILIDDPTDRIHIGNTATNWIELNAETLQYHNGANATINVGSDIQMNALSGSISFQSQSGRVAADSSGVILSGSALTATGLNNFNLSRTITASGTTGNRTIHTPVGTVNFAAGSSLITVTSSITTSTSIILAVTRTNDATCSVKNVVPAAGFFFIQMTANCTAETSVGFWVIN